MSHNINRRPNYPTKGSNKNLQAKAKRKKIGHSFLRWSPVWISGLVVLVAIVQARIQFHRIEQDSVKTTARVEKTYTVSGGRKCDYYVSYYFYIDDSLYHGKTQLKKSVWEKFAPHDPIEIAYEKGNPSNSSWAGYHKD